MKPILLLTFSILFIASCGMTNDEIIKESKYCMDNQMKPKVLYNGFDFTVRKIQCIPF